MDPQLVLSFGGTVFFLALGYALGSYLERRHLRRLEAREAALRGMPCTTFQRLPREWTPTRVDLVTGSVVVSVDYFKRFVAGLRGIFGGRIRTYEPLLDRARREAIVRMLEAARDAGHDAVVNVRIETSRTANADDARQQPTAGVEMLAFGTALTLSPER